MRKLGGREPLLSIIGFHRGRDVYNGLEGRVTDDGVRGRWQGRGGGGCNGVQRGPTEPSSTRRSLVPPTRLRPRWGAPRPYPSRPPTDPSVNVAHGPRASPPDPNKDDLRPPKWADPAAERP